jgi:hypothetical protein
MLRPLIIRVIFVIGAIILVIYSQRYVFAGMLFVIMVLMNIVSLIISRVYDAIDRVRIAIRDIKG